MISALLGETYMSKESFKKAFECDFSGEVRIVYDKRDVIFYVINQIEYPKYGPNYVLKFNGKELSSHEDLIEYLSDDLTLTTNYLIRKIFEYKYKSSAKDANYFNFEKYSLQEKCDFLNISEFISEGDVSKLILKFSEMVNAKLAEEKSSRLKAKYVPYLPILIGTSVFFLIKFIIPFFLGGK